MLGVIREPTLDHRRPVHRVSGTAGDPEKAPPPATHTATLACSTSSGSHELVSTCWLLQLQAETLPAPPPPRPSGQRLRPKEIETLTPVCKPASLPRQGSGARVWRGPWSPLPLPRAERGGGVSPPPAPSPTALETWASCGRGAGMLPSPGRGRKGEGR